MSDVYATRSDLFRYGLPRGMLSNPGRLCASAVAASDTFELDDHGIETGDALMFRAEVGGVLPVPVLAATTYVAIRVSASLFQISDIVGGPAIALTADGRSVVVSTALPVDDVLEFYSRFVDGFLPAHVVPLTTPYPITVTALVAELSAKKLLLIAGQSSQSMTEMEVAAKAQLERWAKGIPLRDAHATGPTNLAVVGSAHIAADPRRWDPRYGFGSGFGSSGGGLP